MPEPTLDDILAQAASAVSYAQDVRSHHRKRTRRGNPQREADLQIALDRLRVVMDPLRSVIGRMQFEVPSKTLAKKYEAVRTASQDVQRERRKLWKMQERKNA
jgi:hypothetical protein